MGKPELVLIGGGGHCRSCIDVIEQEDKFNILGILDLPERQNERILQYSIIGNDDDFEKYRHQGCKFLITLGQIKTAHIRKRFFEKLRVLKAEMATIVSPRAYISEYAEIGKGTIVMHNAFVNVGVKTGVNCILNSGSNLEHDTVIGDHCHISTGVYINGDCAIGNEVFIGSNVTVVNQVNIGDGVVIGAGSVVTKDVKDGQKIAGVPARRI